MSIWKWADRFEPVPSHARVTLGEGHSPLVRSRSLGARYGLNNLWLKLDMISPTGSYKDRFAVVAISHMLAAGRTRCLATSSGNTGAALSAYAAAAGIQCAIAIVETAPHEKLQQMLAYGATLYRIRGFGLEQQVSREVFTILQQAAQRDDSMLQISAFRFSPAGMSGMKSLGYELAEQAEGPIDHIFCPAGGGGMVAAIGYAFDELCAEQSTLARPRVEVVQPIGNDTIVTPLREGLDTAREITCTSRISGLQVPNDIDATAALRVARASGASGQLVSDEEVWQAQAELARQEGIFCEPAGAVSVAGAISAAREGRIARDAHVICVISGSGFKDASSVARMAGAAEAPVVDVDEFARRLT